MVICYSSNRNLIQYVEKKRTCQINNYILGARECIYLLLHQNLIWYNSYKGSYYLIKFIKSATIFQDSFIFCKVQIGKLKGNAVVLTVKTLNTQ